VRTFDGAAPTRYSARREHMRPHLLLLLILAACARPPAPALRFGRDGERVSLGAIGSCSEPERVKAIDPAAPLVVLVHGCNASQGRFRALAELFELHGQQTLCFRYDDRRRLGDVAHELRAVLHDLAGRLARSELTLLGHSQGGLVARAALAGAHEPPLATRGAPLAVSLVTVSAPFNGIEAASDCGARWLHALTLGTTLAVCRAVAGPKWRDIHPHAGMVERPGKLSARVGSHLEIRTDERNTCRQFGSDGRCLRADYVFSVREQNNTRISADGRVTPDLVAAGHAEIVGKDDSPPRKLLGVLQEHGVLAPTPPDKLIALEALLRRLF
jgi:pimeloyl-ACP methyl ester carboxylesterase